MYFKRYEPKYQIKYLKIKYIFQKINISHQNCVPLWCWSSIKQVTIFSVVCIHGDKIRLLTIVRRNLRNIANHGFGLPITSWGRGKTFIKFNKKCIRGEGLIWRWNQNKEFDVHSKNYSHFQYSCNFHRSPKQRWTLDTPKRATAQNQCQYGHYSILHNISRTGTEKRTTKSHSTNAKKKTEYLWAIFSILVGAENVATFPSNNLPLQ